MQPANQPLTQATQAAEVEAKVEESAWTVRRVAGDLAVKTEREERGGEVGFSSGTAIITTPLPQDYPPPTPPGAIELKKYPSVRRAQVSATDVNTDGGRNIAFFPLFGHIQRNEIAMTSPVEMDYPDMQVETTKQDQPAQTNWTMSFLYRTPELGPVDGDAGDAKKQGVRVVDRPAVTVLALGMQGQYLSTRDAAGVVQLREWLDANPQWKAAGPARALYYNGPEVAPARSWSEVQVPVEPVPQ